MENSYAVQHDFSESHVFWAKVLNVPGFAPGVWVTGKRIWVALSKVICVKLVNLLDSQEKMLLGC